MNAQIEPIADDNRKVPARLLIQVRDGVPNVLLKFELSIQRTTILTDDPNGAHFEHSASLYDVRHALETALENVDKEIEEAIHG